MKNRRELLQAAALSAAPAFLPRGRGANSRIRLGIAGLHGRGFSLLRSLLQMTEDNVEVATLCDVDSEVLARRAGEFEKLSNGRRVATAPDMRRMIEDKSLDAIIHATPTHWHCLGGLWTIQAGKDAYIEKPLALTLAEGRKLVAAARKHDRIVQHGTQCRSSPEVLEGMALLREGAIGEVAAARGLGHKYRPGIGPVKPAAPPPTLNYDMWRGPSPMKPYSANQVHYNWHWFWDTGNGDFGNLGVHGLDVMRMALNLSGVPERVQSMGGNFFFHDAKETPNYQTSAFRYRGRNVLLEYSVRNGCTNSEAGMGESIPFTMGSKFDAHAVIIYGSEGFMLIPDFVSYYVYLGRNRKLVKKRVGTGSAESNIPHLRNFFKAMRSRKHTDLNADVEEGRRSAAMCHLANIACRVRRTLVLNPQTEQILGDPEATALTSRTFRPPYDLPNAF